MATYYLSNAGSNTAPYDTEAKAAHSIWSIRGLPGFASTDTIVVCSDITETTFVGGSMSLFCDMEAKDGLSERPKITYNPNSGPYLVNGTGPFSITGIEFINNNAPAPFVTGSVTLHLTDCIFRHNSISPLFSGLNSGTIFEGNLFITSNTVLSAGCQAITYLNNTFIKAVTNGDPLLQCGSSDILVNNILYAPSSLSPTLIARTGSTAFIGNSSNNIILAPDTCYFTQGESTVTDGVGNIRVDPLFLEMVEYTLKRISPAIKAGAGGVNIGWDQVTIGLPADTPMGLITSTPTKSYAGDLLSDSDNGGGIDTTNTNDYNITEDRSVVRSVVDNGYRAPNLR